MADKCRKRQKGGRPRKTKKRAGNACRQRRKPNETQEKRGEENKSIVPVRTTAAIQRARCREMPLLLLLRGKVAAEGKKVAAEEVRHLLKVEKRLLRVKKAVGGMKIVSVDEAERFRLSEYFRGRSWWISLPLPGRTWSWQVSTRDWGKLFLEHQQQVIELFKQHILLYGKGR